MPWQRTAARADARPRLARKSPEASAAARADDACAGVRTTQQQEEERFGRTLKDTGQRMKGPHHQTAVFHSSYRLNSNLRAVCRPSRADAWSYKEKRGLRRRH